MSGYKTFIDHGKVRFTVGNQTFTLDYNPDDEPDCSRMKQLRWMKSMLNNALDNIDKPPMRKMKNEITEPNDK